VKPQQFLHFVENLLYVSFYIRSNIQENVDLIKLQRDMKEKATKFEALQVKYLNLEEVRYQCYLDVKARQGPFTCT